MAFSFTNPQRNHIRAMAAPPPPWQPSANSPPANTNTQTMAAAQPIHHGLITFISARNHHTRAPAKLLCAPNLTIIKSPCSPKQLTNHSLIFPTSLSCCTCKQLPKDKATRASSVQPTCPARAKSPVLLKSEKEEKHAGRTEVEMKEEKQNKSEKRWREEKETQPKTRCRHQ